uniref:Uncharacterized protein n=1 Tax=Opuntia streptacantha TaxID=393608 RepID=A0A7C9CRY6_OPUST
MYTKYVRTFINDIHTEPNEEIIIHRTCHLLPLKHSINGVLLNSPGQLKNRNNFRNPSQLDLVSNNDSKARPSSSSYGPKQVLPHGLPVHDPPLGIHNLSVHHIVGGKPEFSHHIPIPTPAEVAPHSN